MKKYSAVKKFFAATVLFFYVIIISCNSTGSISIPGEEEYRISNITAEYYQIAKAYFDQKNYNKAIEYYQLAMRDNNYRETSKYQTGVCYVMLKNWNSAEKIFNELLKNDPENSTLKSSVAYIKANSGKLNESIDLYRELCEAYPNDSNYLLNYIIVLMADNRFTIAEEKLELLKEKFPEEQQITALQTKIADGLGIKEEPVKEETSETIQNTEPADQIQ